MVNVVLKLSVVYLGQVFVAWLLYRSRAISHSYWANSDFVVFGVPLLVGFVLSALVSYSVVKRASSAFWIAGVGAVASSLVAAVIGFNLYGQ